VPRISIIGNVAAGHSAQVRIGTFDERIAAEEEEGSGT
jgi:hypothetical protein